MRLIALARAFLMSALLLAFACGPATAVASGVSVAGGPLPLTPKVATRIDALANAALKSGRSAGLSIAVVEDGRIAYAKGFGEADLATRAPVTTQTRFAIGSVTKQFTAAAIMQLQEARRLSLDDPVAKYLPDAPHSDLITIRNLLTHTSGLPNYTSQPGMGARAATEPSIAPAALIAMIAKEPLDFTPGTKWEYSNTNYVLLGLIVEKLSGQPLGDYLRAHLFEPAGMASTRFEDARGRDALLAAGYTRERDDLTVAREWYPAWAYAAGGIAATAEDLARWDIALGSGRIVNPASFAQMTTPARLSNGTPTHYGFGLMLTDLGGHRVVQHGGGIPGFEAANVTLPADRFALVVLANSDAFVPDTLVNQIGELFYPKAYAAASLATPASAPGEDPNVTARAKEWFHRLQSNDVDRAQLTPQMDQGLTPDVLAQVSAQIAPLGEPKTFDFAGSRAVGTVTAYVYRVGFSSATWQFLMSIDNDGKIAGLFLKPVP